MNKLNEIDIELCKYNGKIFEESLTKSKLSSPLFIKRFMYSNVAKLFDKKSYLASSFQIEDVFLSLESQYLNEEFGKEKYSKNEMYWIGYIYRALCILYGFSSKNAYTLFPGKEIRKYYFIYHTFDVKYATERMLETIEYNLEDDLTRGLKIYKKILSQNKNHTIEIN